MFEFGASHNKPDCQWASDRLGIAIVRDMVNFRNVRVWEHHVGSQRTYLH